MPGRMNGDKRGNAQQRRARRVKMLSPEGGWGGNGEKVPASAVERCSPTTRLTLTGSCRRLVPLGQRPAVLRLR